MGFSSRARFAILVLRQGEILQARRVEGTRSCGWIARRARHSEVLRSIGIILALLDPFPRYRSHTLGKRTRFRDGRGIDSILLVAPLLFPGSRKAFPSGHSRAAFSSFSKQPPDLPTRRHRCSRRLASAATCKFHQQHRMLPREPIRFGLRSG